MKHRFKIILFILLLLSLGAPVHAATNGVVLSAEIERIVITNPLQIWSGGKIEVGDQWVWIPTNMLIDLPANSLTLKQLFDQRPAACASATGLAKADACHVKAAGFATIYANRTAAGNLIAGDIFIQKGVEIVSGDVTYINYTDGYFRVNGNVVNTTQVDDLTGTMIRLNDPTGRHTVQQGLGCTTVLDPATGRPQFNCSADRRFGLDPDNYTAAFASGVPMCIPSTVLRTFVDVLGLGITTAQALPDGTGDVLCPATNRTVNGGQPMNDSRLFAPLQLGDNVTAKGNLEIITVGTVQTQFLSAHTVTVNKALSTANLPTQPDYIAIANSFIDMPGFQVQRARAQLAGFASTTPADVVFWSVHRDPLTNGKHEFPLASTSGCDAANAKVGTCTNQGLVNVPCDIFRIVLDVNFLKIPAANTKLSPCSHLRHDARFAALNICPSAAADGTSTLGEEFAILSPIPRQVQARTGHKIANPGLVTLDIKGTTATNGQYLFPLGMGLGGIDVPAFVEINLNALQTPTIFEGIPWAVDRRLSPGGCLDALGQPGGTICDATVQRMTPFPSAELDPRIQASVPTTAYNDLNYTATPLTSAANRILSFVDGSIGKFNGDSTLLVPPLSNPNHFVVTPVPTPPILR